MTAKDVHVVRAGPHEPGVTASPKPAEHRGNVEPWLSALCQSEHLSLLIGSGLTSAVAGIADTQAVDLGTTNLENMPHGREVTATAQRSACELGRGNANLEDQIRAMDSLIGGLTVLKGVGETADQCFTKLHGAWKDKKQQVLQVLVRNVLLAEREIGSKVAQAPPTDKGAQIRRYLGGFLLPFASRVATRDRLHIFTTNYDRLIEYGCDLLGLRTIDRFVGSMTPIFRSTRLAIDMHYSPPGIRGEPRYLDGVVRITKLHGSLDWRAPDGPSLGYPQVWRCGLPFGATEDHPDATHKDSDVLVYPNSAKDVETLEYPYAELFRDFATAVCQPNSVVVTYGYGFGDDHINRVLLDMLSIPSTHLAIISYNDAGGRLWTFCERAARRPQITLLVGPHFGDLSTLVDHYLPKAAIDQTTWRMADLINRRLHRAEGPKIGNGVPPEGGAQ